MAESRRCLSGVEGVWGSAVTGLQAQRRVLAVNAGWRRGSDEPSEIGTHRARPPRGKSSSLPIAKPMQKAMSAMA